MAKDMSSQKIARENLFKGNLSWVKRRWKVESIERSSFTDVSAGSFLYFQSHSIFESAKIYSATYNRKKWRFSPIMGIKYYFYRWESSHFINLHARHCHARRAPMSCTATLCTATSCMPKSCMPKSCMPTSCMPTSCMTTSCTPMPCNVCFMSELTATCQLLLKGPKLV